jgi:CrcB protein
VRSLERTEDCMTYLIVFLGGGLGAALRHGANVASLRAFGPSFPYGTLLINVTGSLAMGLIAGWFAFRSGASEGWRLFLTTGILGGFTTFSAFSLDFAALMQRNEQMHAALYLVGSVALSILALYAGMALMRWVLT